MSNWVYMLALWAAVGAAENTYCQPVDAYMCDAAGCRIAPLMEFRILPDTREMQRCDATVCHRLPYDLWVFSGGQTRYIARGGSQVLSVDKNGMFVHITIVDGGAITSIGRCIPAYPS